MYDNIEYEFKKDSYNRKCKMIYTVLIMITCIITGLFCIFQKDKDSSFERAFVVEFTLISIFHILFYVYIFLCVRKFNQISLKAIFKPSKVKKMFDKKAYDYDLDKLYEILIKYGINTRNKLSVVLHHYQSAMYKNVKGNSQLLSILAFVISFLAFVFSEPLLSSYGFLKISLELILLIVLLYLTVIMFNKQFFNFFSKEEFYKRIESYISEIYILHIKNNKLVKKINK